MVFTGAKLLVLGIFLVSYVLIILLYKHKLIVVAVAVAALLALRVRDHIESPAERELGSLQFPTLRVNRVT
jgi:hypothetical protein